MNASSRTSWRDDTPDETLEALLDFSQPLPVLTPAQVHCAQAVQHSWREVDDFRAFRPIALRGNDPATLRAIAWEAARLAGWEMVELRADRLSDSADERRECFAALAGRSPP